MAVHAGLVLDVMREDIPTLNRTLRRLVVVVFLAVQEKPEQSLTTLFERNVVFVHDDLAGVRTV